MGKMKGCPFCGSKLFSIVESEENEFQIQCGNCYAKTGVEETVEKAKFAWNRRVKNRKTSN